MHTCFAGDNRGFTLLELLIAVVIVVILAGIGVPIYLQFQSSAKTAEAGTNLNGIKMAEEGYRWANGSYLDCAASPRAGAVIDEKAVAWTDQGTGFTAIGFTTSADVRFAYEVSGASTTAFVAEALGDTNADGNRILYVATPAKGPHVIGTDATDVALTLSLGTAGDTDD